MNSKKWNEICFLLHGNLKPTISESDFEQKVIQALGELNWKEYTGDVKIRPSIPIGSARQTLKPDFIISSEGINRFVIEIKQPNIPLTAQFQQQLFSYMRQLKLEYGILIGQEIQIFYDGNLIKQENPILLETITFTNDNEKGLQFIKLFSKDTFNQESLRVFTLDILEKINRKEEAKKLIDTCLSVEFEEKVARTKQGETLKRLPTKIATETLSMYFSGGLDVRYEQGNFWKYLKGVWVKSNKASMESKVLATIEYLDGGDLMEASALLTKAFKLFVVMITQEDYFLSDRIPNFIILNNGALNLDTYKLHPLDRSHLAKQKYPVSYDPESRCPLFIKFLSETFTNKGLVDPTDRINNTNLNIMFVLEVLGYMITPKKPIDAWFLLLGSQASGKSTLMTIINSIIGDHQYCPLPLNELKNDTHSTTSLVDKLVVVEDDLEEGCILPDGIIKKHSSNKIVQANPKNKERFSFLNTATIVVLSNNYPRLRDLSGGMKRRTFVIPFKNSVEASQMDLGLIKRITDNEREGVFTVLLQARKQLLKRGFFKPPMDVENATSKWHNNSHSFLQFVEECFTPTHKAHTSLSNAYDVYRMWSLDNQTAAKHIKTKRSFKASLEILGKVKDISLMVVRHSTGYVIRNFTVDGVVNNSF